MTATAPLDESIGGLLRDAAQRLHASPYAPRLARAAQELGAPLRVAVAGVVSAGKSTLLNALLGARVAATDAGECTRFITEYAYGPAPRAWAVLRPGERGGTRRPLGLSLNAARGDQLVVGLDDVTADSLLRIHVELPLPALRTLTVVDTPGTGSMSQNLGERTKEFLSDADRDSSPPPDAVLYVMRRLDPSDIGFLEAFRDPTARAVAPVNAIGVLTRADEIGGGRDNAMLLAEDVALQYSRDPRLRCLLQGVVPVAGLLAEAAGTLTAAEHEQLSALAHLDESVTDALLLSADRFTSARKYAPVDGAARAALADRFGLVGLRWALADLRRGSLDHNGLARRLAARSGLLGLRSMLDSQLTSRAMVLKADAALRLFARGCAASSARDMSDLQERAERIRLSVHDFAEVDLLNRLRTGRTEFQDADRESLELLLGARGSAVDRRLGVTSRAGPQELARMLTEAHGRWRALANDPFASREEQRAASVAVRTCEGLMPRT